VFKRADGWAVRLPVFGFGVAHVETGLPDADAARAYLRHREQRGGSAACEMERAGAQIEHGGGDWTGGVIW